jgi:hypothetical protein
VASVGQARNPRQRHHRPAAAKCPDLNAQANVWQFIRNNWPSNRVFDSTTAPLDHCCDAWNSVGSSALDYHSIGLRDWAHAL